MRKGFDGLYGLVQGRLESDPLSGHLFLFCNQVLSPFLWMADRVRVSDV